MDTPVPNITSHITHVRKAQGLFCYWPRNAKFQYFFPTTFHHRKTLLNMFSEANNKECMYFPNKTRHPNLQISLQMPRLTVTEFNRAVEVLQKASTKSLKPRGVSPGETPGLCFAAELCKTKLLLLFLAQFFFRKKKPSKSEFLKKFPLQQEAGEVVFRCRFFAPTLFCYAQPISTIDVIETSWCGKVCIPWEANARRKYLTHIGFHTAIFVKKVFKPKQWLLKTYRHSKYSHT